MTITGQRVWRLADEVRPAILIGQDVQSITACCCRRLLVSRLFGDRRQAGSRTGLVRVVGSLGAPC